MAKSRNYNQNRGWDPMREDFDNTTYDPQYADEESNVGDVELDQCRLYVRNVPKNVTEEGLRSIFSKYGTLNEMFLSSDPGKRYALVGYEAPGEAKLAMTTLNKMEPLKLLINIAHKKRVNYSQYQTINKRPQQYDRQPPKERRSHADTTSICSSLKDDNNTIRKEEAGNSDKHMNNSFTTETLLDLSLTDNLDPDMSAELEQLQLEYLRLQEAQVVCKTRMILKRNTGKQFSNGSKKNLGMKVMIPNSDGASRSVIDTVQGSEGDLNAAAGDSSMKSNSRGCKTKYCWARTHSTEGSSTASTCVLCSEDQSCTTRDEKDKSVALSRFERTSSKHSELRSECTSKVSEHSTKYTNDSSKHVKSIAGKSRAKKVGHKKSEVSYGEMKYETGEDETARLIRLRNTDYLGVVEDSLKVVVALIGYPKSRMRLCQMERFQSCLNDVINVHLKAGLLKREPKFLDCYLNRGAIVCICKDVATRDWIVHVSLELEDEMLKNVVLLKTKVKRYCMGLLKLSKYSWPSSAQEVFRLLQYFNPNLKTHLWIIYSQKISDNVEITSFFIDRVSGEILRGHLFKNVIDYNAMQFELTGYREIYYDCLMSDADSVCYVTSRVQLLEELRSEETTPRNESKGYTKESSRVREMETEIDSIEQVQNITCRKGDGTDHGMKDADESRMYTQSTFKDNEDVHVIWNEGQSNETCNCEEIFQKKLLVRENNATATSLIVSENDSVMTSNDTILNESAMAIDSNRGIAYHRRTNYLDVDDELKVAITLEGYPLDKLEGTHIRRLKHLFKDYLHKDMKNLRFQEMIVPKFQDVYLSNGAVIYICDSLETKDYISELLPKFINSTGLKLTFRDVKDLVRYTRVVMRVPKEKCQIESNIILMALKQTYPNLKPDCWKYYSDVTGKQKRQFGVDPNSLEVIKSPDFDPIYDGEKLVFRIIDRQKREVKFPNVKREIDDSDDMKEIREVISKIMYTHFEGVNKAQLNKLRTSHYSDLIADDLKVYVGPTNYPEIRVEEALFHSIKRVFENVVCSGFQRGDYTEATIPKFHDMYLFDGVIFIICQNTESKSWIENALSIYNSNNPMQISLKSTEFRGAVGIVTMTIRVDRELDEVIQMLQKQNPRLRTKFWRKISVEEGENEINVNLQIDKLSAQVISGEKFNNLIGDNFVEFKLGHLQSLIESQTHLKESVLKPHKNEKSQDEIDDSVELKRNLKVCLTEHVEDSLEDKIFIKKDGRTDEEVIEVEERNDTIEDYTKMILKVPPSLLIDDKDDLKIIFELFEDRNPGINTKLWQFIKDEYPSKGKFTLLVDNQSAMLIKNKTFNGLIAGETLKFYF